MLPILGLLASNILTTNSPNYNSSSGETTKNKKQFLTKLKYKAMLVKVKVSSGGDEFKEQIINLSMIKEVRQGWGDKLYGLNKDEWCEIRFIDGANLYVASTLDDILTKLSDIQNRDINVTTRRYPSGVGPY